MVSFPKVGYFWIRVCHHRAPKFLVLSVCLFFPVLLCVSLKQNSRLLEPIYSVSKASHALTASLRLQASSNLRLHPTQSGCFLFCVPGEVLLMFWALMMEIVGRRISSAVYSYFQTSSPASPRLGFLICEMGLITSSHWPITEMMQASKGFRTPSTRQNPANVNYHFYYITFFMF